MNNENFRSNVLYMLHENITEECQKTIDYLDRLKWQSENIVSSFVALNSINKLKRYSTIYEHLNKLYVKISEQNCLLEVFLLELSESSINDTIDKNSVNSSIHNLSTFNESYRTGNVSICSHDMSTLGHDLLAINSNTRSRQSSVNHEVDNLCQDKPKTTTDFEPDICKLSLNETVNLVKNVVSNLQTNSSQLQNPFNVITTNQNRAGFVPIHTNKLLTPADIIAHTQVVVDNRDNLKTQRISSNTSENFLEHISKTTVEENHVLESPKIIKHNRSFSNLNPDVPDKQLEVDYQLRIQKIIENTKRKISSSSAVEINNTTTEEIQIPAVLNDTKTIANGTNINSELLSQTNTENPPEDKKTFDSSVEEDTTKENLEKTVISVQSEHDSLSSIDGSKTSSCTSKIDNVSSSSSSSSSLNPSLNVSPAKPPKNSASILKTFEQSMRRINERMNLKSMVTIPDLRPTIEVNREHRTVKAKDVTKPKQKQKRRSIPKDYVYSSSDEVIETKRAPVPKEGDLCYVSYVESPSLFYIQVIREDNTLVDYISEQVVEIVDRLRTFKTKLDAYNSIKRYCICYVEQFNSWFRAEVRDWILEDVEKIEICLLDHGHISLVSFRDIREGLSYLFQLPVIAEKCELPWIKPANEEQYWCLEASEYFYEIVDPDTNKLFTITFVEQKGDSFLIDMKSTEIESVATNMIDKGYAVVNIPEDVLPVPPAVEETTKEIPPMHGTKGHLLLDEYMRAQVLKAQGLSDTDFAEEDQVDQPFEIGDEEEVNDPTIAVSHYKPKDDMEVCRIQLARGHCFKGDNCTFSHKNLNPDGWTTDRDPVYWTTFNQINLPSSNTEITVKVLNIVNLRTFYVAIFNFPTHTNIISSPLNTMNSLVDAMNNPEVIKTYKRSLIIPAVSQMVLVKYQGDKWQRGRVIEFDEFASKVELIVFMVDFGDHIKVNLKDTRVMQEQFLHLPFQAVQCTLVNVSLKNDITEEQYDMAQDYQEMNLLNQKLKAKVIHSGIHLSIQLFDINGKDVGEELLKAGIVEQCTVGLEPLPNSNFLVD